jgi:CheY-like chemotaxis protein
MPGMDGFGVARQLRQNPNTRDIVIVAFTAQDSSTVRRSGMAAGFDGYCQKAGAPRRSGTCCARCRGSGSTIRTVARQLKALSGMAISTHLPYLTGVKRAQMRS